CCPISPPRDPLPARRPTSQIKLTHADSSSADRALLGARRTKTATLLALTRVRALSGLGLLLHGQCYGLCVCFAQLAVESDLGIAIAPRRRHDHVPGAHVAVRANLDPVAACRIFERLFDLPRAGNDLPPGGEGLLLLVEKHVAPATGQPHSARV